MYIKKYTRGNKMKKNILQAIIPRIMATVQEKLTAIKDKYKELFARHKISLSVEDEQALKFEAEAKDASGNMVYTPAAAFEVGAEVYTMDADGNPQPAADGEYVLDGALKVIVAGGMISEVEAVAAEEEDMSDVVAQLADRLTAIEAKLSETETKLSESEAARTTAETKLAAETKRANELAKKAVPSTKETFSKEDKKKGEAKKPNTLAERILAGINQSKNN